VSRIGQQRQRAGAPAVEGLDQDKADIERDAHRKGAPEIARRVDMVMFSHGVSF
jgi:hypothetical protein